MFGFMHLCAFFGQEVGENVRKCALFVRFWRTFVFGVKIRVEKSRGKSEDFEKIFRKLKIPNSKLRIHQGTPPQGVPYGTGGAMSKLKC